jgi:hypothetical protein
VSQYRDPLAGLRSQVATKRAALEDRARAISPIVGAMLPPAIRNAMADLGPRAATGAEDMKGLSEQDAALDALLAVYDEAIAIAPTLVGLPDTVPDPQRPKLPPPWLFEEPFFVRFKKALTKRVESVADGEAWLVRWGDFGYLSRIRVEGTPLVFLAHGDDQLGTFRSTLRTSVPARVPHLEVRRTSAYHSIGRAMHLTNEISLGDEIFDKTFWISGHEATATLLVPAVRRALLALSGHGASLFVGDGIAELAWGGGWNDPAEVVLPDTAVSVVRAVRAAIA